MTKRVTTLLGRGFKAQDLELHALLTSIDGVQVIELADYIVSTGQYGRSNWFPLERALDLLPQLTAEMRSVAE